MIMDHYWGNVECLKLNTENHSQIRKRIPLSFPPLFRNAVSVVHR
jgi:hypothetical protein